MRLCAHWILTFRDLHNGVRRMVNVLRSLGVSARDRVMLLAKDGLVFVRSALVPSPIRFLKNRF